MGSRGSSKSESPATPPLFEGANAPYHTPPSVPSPSMETPAVAPDFSPEWAVSMAIDVKEDPDDERKPDLKLKKAAKKKMRREKVQPETAAEEPTPLTSFEI